MQHRGADRPEQVEKRGPPGGRMSAMGSAKDRPSRHPGSIRSHVLGSRGRRTACRRPGSESRSSIGDRLERPKPQVTRTRATFRASSSNILRARPGARRGRLRRSMVGRSPGDWRNVFVRSDAGTRCDHLVLADGVSLPRHGLRQVSGGEKIPKFDRMSSSNGKGGQRGGNRAPLQWRPGPKTIRLCDRCSGLERKGQWSDSRALPASFHFATSFGFRHRV